MINKFNQGFLMKAIIFDMDGLMIDTEKFYFDAEREMASEYGKIASDELLRGLMGMSPKDAAKIFINKLNITMTDEEFMEKRRKKMEEKYNNELEPIKGLFEIINKFHGKIKLAIATGSPEKFLDIVVDKLNIRNLFDVLQPSDEIKIGKPDPEIYLETIKKLKLIPEECIVLEDSSNGALAGKRAGCYTIAVLNQYSKYDDFTFADFVVNDLFEASRYIEIILNKKKIEPEKILLN
jgi:HAD superfamily hydrolase (TIGR01509 family)